MNERSETTVLDTSTIRVRNNATPTSTQQLVDMPILPSTETRTLMPGLRRKSSIRRPPSPFYCLRYVLNPDVATAVASSTTVGLKVLAFVSLLLVNAYLLQSHEYTILHSDHPSHRLLRGHNALWNTTLDVVVPSMDAVVPSIEEDDDGNTAEQYKEEMEDSLEFFDQLVPTKQQ